MSLIRVSEVDVAGINDEICNGLHGLTVWRELTRLITAKANWIDAVRTRRGKLSIALRG